MQGGDAWTLKTRIYPFAVALLTLVVVKELIKSTLLFSTLFTDLTRNPKMFKFATTSMFMPFFLFKQRYWNWYQLARIEPQSWPIAVDLFLEGM